MGTSIAVVPGAAQPMYYRQGTVISWNPLTAQNVVQVGNTNLIDLPILNTSEASLLQAGSVVALVVVGSTWAILGRMVIPGTPEAATALELVSSNIYTAVIAASGQTTSDTFGDLDTGVGPEILDVNITRSGKALVIVSMTGATSGGDPLNGGAMAYVISGATTRTVPHNSTSMTLVAGTIGFAWGGSRVFLEENLNPGLHTFTAKYRASHSGEIFEADNRVLTVFAL